MGRKTIQPVPGFKNRRRDGTPSENAKVIQPVPGFGKRKRPQPIGQNPVMGIVTPPPYKGKKPKRPPVVSLPPVRPPVVARPNKKGSKPNAGFRSKKFPGVM